MRWNFKLPVRTLFWEVAHIRKIQFRRLIVISTFEMYLSWKGHIFSDIRTWTGYLQHFYFDNIFHLNLGRVPPNLTSQIQRNSKKERMHDLQFETHKNKLVALNASHRWYDHLFLPTIWIEKCNHSTILFLNFNALLGRIRERFKGFLSAGCFWKSC